MRFGSVLSKTIQMQRQENKNPHAVALGKLGGKRTSEAKRLAAQANGKKGGRPKKEIL